MGTILAIKSLEIEYYSIIIFQYNSYLRKFFLVYDINLLVYPISMLPAITIEKSQLVELLQPVQVVHWRKLMMGF